jgi:hypothetical protein
LLPIGIGLSDYVDALIDPSAPDVADRLLAAIVETCGWDECTLPELPPDAAMCTAACPPGLIETVAVAAPCPVLELPCGVATLDGIVPRLRDLRQARARAIARSRPSAKTISRSRCGSPLVSLFRSKNERNQAGPRGVPHCVRPKRRCAGRPIAATPSARFPWQPISHPPKSARSSA